MVVKVAKTAVGGVKDLCVSGGKLKLFTTGRIKDGNFSSETGEPAGIVVFVVTSCGIPEIIVGYTCTADVACGTCRCTNDDLDASILNVLVLKLTVAG